MNAKASRREIARVVTAKLLAEPARQAHWVRVLAAYVLEHGLVGELDLLVNDIARELFEQAGLLTVEVASAEKLAGDVRRDLTSFLSAQTGAKRTILHESREPALIGGLVARTPDAELDASVIRNIRRLSAMA